MPPLCKEKLLLLVRLREERDKYVEQGGSITNVTEYWREIVKKQHPHWPPRTTFNLYAGNNKLKRKRILIKQMPADLGAKSGERNGTFYNTLDAADMQMDDDAGFPDSISIGSDEPAALGRDLQRYCEAEGEDLKGFIADAKEKGTTHPKLHLFELWQICSKAEEFDWWLRYVGYSERSSLRMHLWQFRRTLFDRHSALKRLMARAHNVEDQPSVSEMEHIDWTVVWKDLHRWHPWPKVLAFPGAQPRAGGAGKRKRGMEGGDDIDGPRRLSDFAPAPPPPAVVATAPPTHR